MKDAEVVVRVDVDSDNEEEDGDDFIPAFQLAQELDFATMESNLKAELKAFIYIDVESLMGKLGKWWWYLVFVVSMTCQIDVNDH